MNRLPVFCLVATSYLLSSCQNQTTPSEALNLCTQTWYQSVESAITTGDGMGHGPDIGSEEWRSVIEFRLGVRGSSDVPDRNTQEWCSYIDALIKKRAK